jgi:hypothetical protein
MKTCTKCGIPKPASEFSADRQKADGLKYTCKACDRLYYLANHERMKETARTWYAQNTERARARESTEEYKVKHRDRTNRRRQEHPDIVRTSENKALAKRLAKDPGYLAYHTVMAVTKRRKACPEWLTKAQKQEILDFYNLCKELQWLSNTKLTVDHIVPLHGTEVSGLHVPWNLQILPLEMNSSKGRKLL